jgi:glycosyltransferase involved in cell wall biosynthesis
MKITFDHQIFSMQNYGGISRYFFELIRALNMLQDVETSLTVTYSNNQYLTSARHHPYRHFFKRKAFRYRENLIYLLNLPKSISALKSGELGIFHPTYYNPYFLRHLNKKPYVLTVYDMIHNLFPGEFTGKGNMSERKKILIENATRIIAISENTKKDILKFHSVDADKIHVIHLGDSLSNHAIQPVRHAGLPDKYILFVGLRSGYKNFAFFLESIAELFLQESDLHLICIGGGAFTQAESALFDRLGISKRVRQRSASDETLAGYYLQAAMFVFPSLYEGFGIPVLEAFGTGCPIAISSSSSFPEVAGDAAVYFDPLDSQSILTAVKSLLNDGALRSRLKRDGFERIKLFHWESTARKTRDVYKCIAESGR